MNMKTFADWESAWDYVRDANHPTRVRVTDERPGTATLFPGGHWNPDAEAERNQRPPDHWNALHRPEREGSDGK
jgi:hypothetical protein